MPHQLTADKLLQADLNTARLVKKAEAYFRVLPPALPEFNHFTPAEYLLLHPDLLDGDDDPVVETLARAERVVAALNSILK